MLQGLNLHPAAPVRSPKLVVLVELDTDFPPTFLLAHARDVGAGVEQARARDVRFWLKAGMP